MSTPIVLRIADLHGATRELVWPGPRLTIGSSSSCDLPLAGRGVAEHHCMLEVSADGPVLRDSGSHTGTFVDNERLDAPRRLAPGDRIYIGEYRLELVAPTRLRARPLATVQLGIAAPSFLRLHAARLTLASIIALTSVAVMLALWPATPGPARITVAASPSPAAAPAPIPTTTPSTMPPARQRVTVHHEVIPGELLADIATRYNVSIHTLVEENSVSPDLPPPTGKILTVHAFDPPLQPLRLRHKVEPGDTWVSLSERFELGVELLHRFNPELHGELAPGSDFIVWVDPQIEVGRDEPVFEQFPTSSDALSVDAPSAGTLEKGLQLPSSDQYVSIFPELQYGSSHTIKHLRSAIAAFRQHYRYPGVLVVSNLSQPEGGPFKPHVSHQSGRDVDIWLPALKGTYQHKHLKTDRKPKTEEINWYAAWGLVESLLATKQVLYIFLDRTLLPDLYKAAEKMGASPRLLAQIQWQPDSVPPAQAQLAQRSAAVRHAAAHTGHIHVRFRCGPQEPRCRERPEIEEP